MRSEQGKLPAATAFRLAERDKHMSEHNLTQEKLVEVLLPLCRTARINGKWVKGGRYYRDLAEELGEPLAALAAAISVVTLISIALRLLR